MKFDNGSRRGSRGVCKLKRVIGGVALVLASVLVLSGCADIEIRTEIDRSGELTEVAFTMATDQRAMFRLIVPRMAEMYQEVARDGHEAYIFMDIEESEPPYRATITFDYTIAREEGFLYLHGLYGLIEDHGLTESGQPFISYKMKPEPVEPDDDGETAIDAELFSFRIVTVMPTQIESHTPGVGFVSRDRRTHTFQTNMKSLSDLGFEYQVVSEKPGLW